MKNFIQKISNISLLETATLLTSVLLLLCLMPMPFGYYSLVRLVVAVVCGCWCYQFYASKQLPLLVLSLFVLILFQPVLKITMDRLTWNTVDVIVAVSFLLLVCYKLKIK